MLDITEWLEELSNILEITLEERPEFAVSMLQLASENTQTPAEAMVLMMQCVFLILLSFDENANWEEEPARAGLLPALFYLSEQWAEDQIALAGQIRKSKEIPDSHISEIKNIINRVNQNGHPDSEHDNNGGDSTD